MKRTLPFLFILFFFQMPSAWAELDTVKVSGDKDMLIAALLEEQRQALYELHVAEKGEDAGAKRLACLKVGHLYRREKLFARALVYYKKAEEWAAAQGNEQVLLEANLLVAETLLANDKAREAHDVFLAVFSKTEKSGGHGQNLRILQNLADAATATKNFKQADAYYLKIKELIEAQGDKASLPTALNNLGFAAHQRKDYAAAIRYFTQAEEVAKNLGVQAPAYVFANLGIAWNNLGEPVRSVDNLRRAEDGESSDADKSYVRHLIATIYLKNNDLYNALRYNEIALKSARKAGNPQVLCDAYDVASEIFQGLYEYDKALDFYKKHLALKDSLLLEERLRQQALENLHGLLEQTENEVKENLAAQELRQLAVAQLELTNQTLLLEADNRRLTAEQQENELALLRREQEVREANLRAAQLEAERSRQALRLATQQLLAEKQVREIAGLNQQRQLDSLEAARMQATQQQQISLLESQKKLADLQLQQDEAFRKNAFRLGGLLGLILFIISASWLYARRLNKRLALQNRQIEAQKQEIDLERSRSESLLLNILPGEVAKELKINGSSKPRHYPSVTVLFTDFADFTKIAAGLPPGEVVQELNQFFLAFDEICERYRLEKIKTIGDSYMCAGGLPAENTTHPADAVSAAIEMMRFTQQKNREKRAAGLVEWPIRIGMHTGEVVAGVAGSKKFAYDIWGDTVNVASRMENNAETGQINISATTYGWVKNSFPCRYRGEVEVKNKGKMGMYEVEI